MKKKDYINISVIIFISIIVIFSVTKISNTFGSDTDWINQHTIFPDYLRNKFYETGSLIPNFSFNYGAGQNIYNISYYGLLSPIILPSYLLPFLSMTSYMTIIAFISIFVSIYLFYKWIHNNKFDSNTCLISTLAFALSAPFIFHFHRHIMFVNYMPFLILSLIQIDKLIDKNLKSPLIISVFLMIMTSYYYSVGALIVLCIYYIYKYVKKNNKLFTKEFFKNLFIFLLLLLIAVLLSSILLLPTIHTILSGRIESESTTKIIDLFIPYLKIHKLFCGTYAIGYSIFGFISLLYLFFTKKKENVLASTLVSIVLFIPIFRYILNGGLYLREKCFIPFIPLIGYFLTIFINDYKNDKINIKKFIIYLLIINIPLYFFNRKELCYISLIAIILILIINLKWKNKKLLPIFIITIMFGTSLIENLNEEFISIDDYKNYFSTEANEKINNILLNDNSIYRISNLINPTKTVNKIYNNKHLSTAFYSSTYNNYYLNFARNIFKINNTDYNYFFLSPSTNMLFNMFMNVKYIYSNYNIGQNYQFIGNNTYKAINTLPYIYHTNKLINESLFDNINYPYNIEVLLNNSVVSNGNNNYFTTIKKENINFDFNNLYNENITIKKENDLIYIEALKDTEFKIELNNNYINKILFINFNNNKKDSCKNGNTYISINNITNLTTCYSWIYQNRNDTYHYVISDYNIDSLNIKIGKGKYEISNIEIYSLDYNNLKTINNNITPLQIDSIKNDKIKGNININNDGYLITSIPYDKGFVIKVNNKIIDYEIVNKAFIGFKLNKGNYNIEIEYKTPLLKEGKIISLLSLLLLIIIYTFDVRKTKSRKN